jgi:hypothetical protein
MILGVPWPPSRISVTLSRPNALPPASIALVSWHLRSQVFILVRLFLVLGAPSPCDTLSSSQPVSADLAVSQRQYRETPLVASSHGPYIVRTMLCLSLNLS